MEPTVTVCGEWRTHARKHTTLISAVSWELTGTGVRYDAERIAMEYSAAVNHALPTGVYLINNQFISTVGPQPHLDIAAVVASVNLGVIARRNKRELTGTYSRHLRNLR